MENKEIKNKLKKIMENMKLMNEKIHLLRDIINGKPYLEDGKITRLLKTWRNK
tara:strand:- start:197 stop:355 length:159 start_codon:yes stop_codon:yes gene_type:complete